MSPLKSSEPPKPVWRWIVPLLLAVVILLVAALFFIGQMQSIEQQMEIISARLGNVLEKAETAAEQAETASRQAEAAEAHAREAAEGRVLAESERDSAVQEAQVARGEANQLRRERQEELDRLQQSLNKLVETRRTALGVVMNLGSDFIQFDFDKATLRPRDKELLSRIVGILLTSDGYRVEVVGHTDDVGSDAYNQDLSERRAQAVRDYVVEAGIDPSIITTKGFGKSNPLVDGTTAEARARNRRVEIGIVDTVVHYRQALP